MNLNILILLLTVLNLVYSIASSPSIERISEVVSTKKTHHKKVQPQSQARAQSLASYPSAASQPNNGQSSPNGGSSNNNNGRSSKLLPIDLRSINDWDLTDLLLVSDIDGNLHGIERDTGGLLWTLPIDDPLVKISTNTTETSNSTQQSNILWFVEPYDDGSLYYFTPKFGLNQLPTSIKNLVLESPFSLSGDDKIYTGSRKTSLYTINIHTGHVISSYGNSQDEFCPIPNIHRRRTTTHSTSSPNSQHALDLEDTIMIGKTTYELSIYSKENTNIVWNVTYSQWGPNNIDNDLIVQNEQSVDKLYFTPFHDKSLLGINKDLGTPVWISRLPSLAVNVFDVFKSTKQLRSQSPTTSSPSFVCLPHPLKLLNDLQLSQAEAEKSNDYVFIDKTVGGKEWFAMSHKNYPTLIKSAPLSSFESFLSSTSDSSTGPGFGDHLRNLQVSGNQVDQKDVEELLSGIHRTYRLNAENFYQPVSKWGPDGRKTTQPPLKQIDGAERAPVGDGSNKYPGSSSIRSDEVALTADHDVSTTDDPNIIDGIWFPHSQAGNENDVILLDGDMSSSISTNRPPQVAPQFYEVEDTTTVKSLNLIKRICEDIIVILVLLVLLMSFGKLGKFTRNFARIILGREDKSEETNVDFKTVSGSSKMDEESEIKKSEERIDSAKEEIIEKSKLGQISDVSVSTIPLEESSEDSIAVSNADSTTATSKRVTISVPNPDPLDPSEVFDEDGHDPTSKKKRKRGARGGKRGGKTTKKSSPEQDDKDKEDDSIEEESSRVISTTSLIKTQTITTSPIKKLQIENNLILSDKILGYGSHGTVVFEGTFENRPVAVKRMLLDFFDIASHEVRLLQESDDHPNVIRYFCSQSSESEKFLYIALELCLCSLEDIIEKPSTIRIPTIANGGCSAQIVATSKGSFIPVINRMLLQLASGLHYLHSLKIVHRDLKPQNILVGDAASKKNKRTVANVDSNATNSDTEIRLLISDFGLCKKLDNDQSSFRATTQHAASGTSGWRAPELLLNHDISEISPETVSSIHSNSGTNHSTSSISKANGDKSPSAGSGKRLTKAIDIFSLGCVFYYILTGGSHPFGDRYLREGNIIKGDYDLTPLKSACPYDNVESMHLISSMINYNPRSRPDTTEILKHPFFWSQGKKLEFLLKVSDRFEIERRDPPSELLLKLEALSDRVCKLDWHSKMDEEFLDNLGKYRKYHTTKLMDLLRALRNKYHHYNDMPESLQKQLSPLPNGFYNYFNVRFPNMLMETYFLVMENLRDEHVFEEYY